MTGSIRQLLANGKQYWPICCRLASQHNLQKPIIISASHQSRWLHNNNGHTHSVFLFGLRAASLDKSQFLLNLPAAYLFSKHTLATKQEQVVKKSGADDFIDIEKEKEERRKRQIRYTNYSFFVLCAGLAGFVGYAVYNWGRPMIGEDGNPLRDEYTDLPAWKQFPLRTWATLRNYKQAFEEPSRDLLLPPPVQYPYQQPKYTLVFETNGILLHPEWTYQTGWRFKKRPHIDQFLARIGPPKFETVAFTQDSGLTAVNLIDGLDPQQLIMFRLFRDSTRYVDGKRIKDLNYLNRDLSKVIHIDWNREACSLNPHNCIILDKWLGDSSDTTLIDLADFLCMLAAQDLDDVREIIAYYSQFDKPLEKWREVRRAQEEQEQQTRKPKPKSLVQSMRKVL